MGEGIFTVADLAARIGARVEGDPEARISGLAPLHTAQPHDLSHLSSPAWRRHLAGSRAGAIIVAPADAGRVPGTALIVDRPYLAYARLSALFAHAPEPVPGVSEHAVVDPSALLGDAVSVAAGAVIGAGAKLGAGTSVGANAVVGTDAELGADCRVLPGAIISHGVRMGARCVVHAAAVVGADGFGFAPDEDDRLVAIAQIGTVVLGDDVEIGACTSIDRGALGDTIIERGVKIDNQVQIGHNVRIGHDSVICGCVGIVGSTMIGAHCVLAGGVGVGGDGPISIADGTVISGMTHVSRSIEEAGTYSSGSLHQPTRKWKRNAIRLTQLDELARRVATLERELATAVAALQQSVNDQDDS